MRIFLIMAGFLVTGFSEAQIQMTRLDGGSVTLKLGMGISVNSNSTLSREFIILNDAKCPVQLDGVGIAASYATSRYSLKPVGNVKTSEAITAYEIRHVLYDVFGDHIKTLSNTDVADINGTASFNKYSSWYASENQISEYLTVVSYVAYVRNANGVIWRSNFNEIKEQIQQIELQFDETFAPKEDTDK